MSSMGTNTWGPSTGVKPDDSESEAENLDDPTEP